MCPEAMAEHPVAGASLWECRAAQSRQVRLEEAQGPGWGTAKGGALTMLACAVNLPTLSAGQDMDKPEGVGEMEH